jgi:hypothetical protein
LSAERAAASAAGLDLRQEDVERLIEQRRLFQVHPVAAAHDKVLAMRPTCC